MKRSGTRARFAMAVLLGVSAPPACSASGTSSDRGGSGASSGRGASSASGGSSGSASGGASGGINSGGSNGAGVGGSAGAAGSGAGSSGVGGGGFGGDFGGSTGGSSGTGTSTGGSGGCDPRERPCDAGTDGPPTCRPGMICKPGAIRYCDSGGFEFQKSVCDASGNWGPCQATPPPPGWCEPPGGFSPELCCPPLKLCCQDETGGPFVDFGSGACAANECP